MCSFIKRTILSIEICLYPPLVSSYCIELFLKNMNVVVKDFSTSSSADKVIEKDSFNKYIYYKLHIKIAQMFKSSFS